MDIIYPRLEDKFDASVAHYSKHNSKRASPCGFIYPRFEDNKYEV